MERLLSDREFRVRSFRLSPSTEFDLASLHLPRASVFVIDVSSSIGIETLIEEIYSIYPHSRILVIKETLRDDRVFPYIRLKVRGIVRYVDARRDLSRAVKAVAEGEIWLSREQLVRFLDWMLATCQPFTLSEPGLLSRRERQVLTSILQGQSNKEIAGMLNISESTVKFHVSRILRKFGSHRRSDLIAKQSQLWSVAS
jgi:DNA-binding NarL/FixJ family response regulator